MHLIRLQSWPACFYTQHVQHVENNCFGAALAASRAFQVAGEGNISLARGHVRLVEEPQTFGCDGADHELGQELRGNQC